MSTDSGGYRERTLTISDPHGVLALVLVAAVAFVAAYILAPSRPAAPAAPAIQPAPPQRPYVAACPWCGRAITIDPAKPTGQSIGKVIGEAKE
jgi:hypothetical protein